MELEANGEVRELPLIGFMRAVFCSPVDLLSIEASEGVRPMSVRWTSAIVTVWPQD